MDNACDRHEAHSIAPQSEGSKGFVPNRRPEDYSAARFTHIARGRRAHRDEFFGRGRMRAKRWRRNRPWSPSFDGDADGLHDFGSGIADDMAANHAIAAAIHDQLHQNSRIAADIVDLIGLKSVL